MKIWTTHLRAGSAPVLVREGFSWWALLFGPLWFFAQRAWIAAVIDLALAVLITALAGDDLRTLLLLVLAVTQGVFGHDIVRWSLARRRFAMVHVLAARDEEGAILRLLQRRPDLAGAFVPPGDLP